DVLAIGSVGWVESSRPTTPNPNPNPLLGGSRSGRGLDSGSGSGRLRWVSKTRPTLQQTTVRLELRVSAMIRIRHTHRRGFTIIELMVSMALIILIMVVISEAFSAGLTAFRQLKGIGTMQERLRIAATMLRRDLQLRHFEGNRRLSDFDPYWYDPNIGNGDGTTRAIGGPPTAGSFRLPPPPLGASNLTYLRLEGYAAHGTPRFVTAQNNTTLATLPKNTPAPHSTKNFVPDPRAPLPRDHFSTRPPPPSQPPAVPPTAPLDTQ